MGIFKKIDNYIRRSNDAWHEANHAYLERQREEEKREKMRKLEKQAEERKWNSIECCANCRYFSQQLGYYYCSKNDMRLKHGENYYRVKCSGFWKNL